MVFASHILGDSADLIKKLKEDLELMFLKNADLKDIAVRYAFLGDCYRLLGDHDEACTWYNNCLPIFQSLGNKELVGKVCLDLGESSRQVNRYSEAMEYLTECMTNAQEVQDKQTECRCYIYLSSLQFDLACLEESIRLAKIALEIANELNFPSEREGACEQLGLLYDSLGCVDEVIGYYNQLIQSSKQSGNKIHEGVAYKRLTIFYLHRIFDYDEANRCAEKRLQLANETELLSEKACAYDTMGQVLCAQTKFNEATTYHLKSLDIAKTIKDKDLEYRAYLQLGVAAKSLGRNYDAIKYFSQSIDLVSQFTSNSHKRNLGVALGKLGEVYRQLGDYNEATKCLEKSLELAQITCCLQSQCVSYINLASVYEQLDKCCQAREYRLKFIILAVRIGDKRGEMYYYQELADSFVYQNQTDKGIRCHKKAVDLALKIREYSSIVVTYAKLAGIYIELEWSGKVIETIEELLEISTQAGDKNFQTRCYVALSNTYRHLAHQHKQEPHMYTKYMNQAEKCIKESVCNWDQQFDDLRDQHNCKLSISDRYLSARAQFTSILIETEKTFDALVVAETGRARILSETLASKYNMDDKALPPQLTEETLTEAEIFNVVPSNACIVFYCFSFGDNSTFVWVLPKNETPMKFIEKKIGVNKGLLMINGCVQHLTYVYQLVQKVHDSIVNDGLEPVTRCEDRSLGRCMITNNGEGSDQIYPSDVQGSFHRNNVDNYNTFDECVDNSRSPESVSPEIKAIVDCKEPLKELFTEFITPVQEYLTEDEVVIVPEGMLYLVPFAALQDPQTGRFLCETKRIRLAPSLTTLQHLRDCPADFHSKTGALVIGNPLVGEVMFRGEKQTFSSLPSAAMEAGVFSSILSVSPLIGIDATKDAVKERLQQDAAVIHIAAHGDDTTGEIALAPGISAQSKAIPEEEDYILTMQEVQEIGVRAKLVVLSCCHSGRGEIRTEGVVGMARAFLAAGARAVVASLWAIDDEATLDFMAGFYMHLRRGRSASVSLNESMKELIREKRYSHPKYWAPFFLIGDDVTIF